MTLTAPNENIELYARATAVTDAMKQFDTPSNINDVFKPSGDHAAMVPSLDKMMKAALDIPLRQLAANETAAVTAQSAEQEIPTTPRNE